MIISNWVEKKLEENLRKSRQGYAATIRKESYEKGFEQAHKEGFKMGFEQGRAFERGFEQGRAYERERIAAETNGKASDDTHRENNR